MLPALLPLLSVGLPHLCRSWTGFRIGLTHGRPQEGRGAAYQTVVGPWDRAVQPALPGVRTHYRTIPLSGLTHPSRRPTAPRCLGKGSMPTQIADYQSLVDAGLEGRRRLSVASARIRAPAPAARRWLCRFRLQLSVSQRRSWLRAPPSTSSEIQLSTLACGAHFSSD